MKGFRDLALHPSSLSLSADDIVEFHLARILLLIKICGRKNRIAGLTKFAKLDFFVRYPDFYLRAKTSLEDRQAAHIEKTDKRQSVESSMVRHHYGPWDKRYYQLLARLSAFGLISVEKSKNTYNIELTEAGAQYAAMLVDDDAFDDLASHMADVGKTFGGKNGTQLKNLIYQTFEDEVADRPMGENI